MTPDEIDIIVRVAGATLLLTSAALLAARGDKRSGLFFLPLAICLCAFLAGNTPEPVLRLGGFAGQTARMLSGFAAAFLWWFCLSVFDLTFRPRGLVLATGFAWLAIAALDRGLFGQALKGVGLSWLLVGIGFGMVAHLAWQLIRDWQGDLIDGRRQARFAVVLLLGGQLFADLFIDLVMGLDWQPHAFSILQNAVILIFTGWLLQLQFRSSARPGEAFGEAAGGPPVSAVAPPKSDPLRERLRVLIEDDRVHLDPGLTFDRFVSMMGAPDRAVRRLINQQLGYDHFRTFLNTHRMIEARRRLGDPVHRRDKLITVAMDSGFSSLASFNRVFRDAESCPPSVFREQALASVEELVGPASRPSPSSEERSADS